MQLQRSSAFDRQEKDERRKGSKEGGSAGWRGEADEAATIDYDDAD